MPIHVRFQDGAQAGKDLPVFDDDVQRIVIGRDPARCQVVFPDDDRVGREHCTLERQAGRYQIRVNREDVVLCGGKRMYDTQELELDRESKLQLGKAGPVLAVRPWLAGVRTIDPDPIVPVPEQVTRVRTWVMGSVIAILLVAAALTIGTLTNWKWVRTITKGQEKTDLAVTNLGEQQKSQEKKIGVLQTLTQQQRDKLSDAANHLRSALMIVGFAADPGDSQSTSAVATGFVISLEKNNCLLATNAHVADLLGSGQHLYAVPDGKTATDQYQVESVFYHPGVVRISPQGPRKISTKPGDGEVDQFSPDVAILKLKDDGKGLAQGITKAELATPEEIKNLSNPAVGMSGYPGAESQFPTNDMTVKADNRDGNINRITGFNRKPDKDPRNEQLVGYMIVTENGFSGSPVFLENGHVVAINNSHHRNMGGNVQTYGIRIDCLWELLQDYRQHNGADKLIPPPDGWDSGRLAAHVEPKPQLDAGGWAAVGLLQDAQLLNVPGDTTAVKLSFDQKINLCNEAIQKAGEYPFVYLACGRVYGQQSDDEQLSQQDRLKHLGSAETNFRTALGLGPDHAPPLDTNCLEAELWLCRIDTVKASLNSTDQRRDSQTIINDIDRILHDRNTSLTKRLESLGWRIRAKCHWDIQEAGMDLDSAVKALPQLPENLLMRADYYDKHDSFQRPEYAKNDRSQAKQIPESIKQAYAALNQAKQWASAHAGDASGVETARGQALQAVNQTFKQEWNCLDCYAHIRALGGDPNDAIQNALKASKWAPDAAERFLSQEDVYEFHNTGRKSP